jgi:CxxC motif-containing protein (DUF1111 family)
MALTACIEAASEGDARGRSGDAAPPPSASSVGPPPAHDPSGGTTAKIAAPSPGRDAGAAEGGPSAVVSCGGKDVTVVPLFGAAPATRPVVDARADGTLVTRGAGRVRGRHELEETFAPYPGRYWEHRSYAFEIEDTVAAGGGTVKVTYRPHAPVSKFGSPTNLRVWKVYGAGNVFHTNADMRVVSPTQLEHTITRNARDARPMKVGDLLEFEFGIFIAGQDPRDPGKIEGRTNYYSDTFRYRVGQGGLTPENRDGSGRPGPTAAARLGGDTTIPWLYAEPRLAWTQLALNVQPEHVQAFLEGRRLFHTRFDTGAHTETSCDEVPDPVICNPVWKTQAGKAGPLFNTTTCVTCHAGNGGGQPLAPGQGLDVKSSMVFKLYGAGALGNQLQPQEGSARALSAEARVVRFPDGIEVALERTEFRATTPSGAALHHSARVARRLVGLGLLEAIAEEDILARADAADCDEDGIAGRAQLVPDPMTGQPRLGRFGWKAEKVSVEHQVADALDADLGVSTSLLPGGGAPELVDEDLARLTTYMRLLGVPARRDVDAPAVKRGEHLFADLGCASCHVPVARTSDRHPLPELRGQIVFPYSDLLLHDLGEDLADGSGTSQARLWRTPPLWGLGLQQEVSGHTRLLHDGRARNTTEAILWHGGEAAVARARFIALSKADRDALLAFLSSL